MVSAVTTDKDSEFLFLKGGYTDGSDVFYFGFKWTVSAGSFGISPDYFIVNSYLDEE